MSVFARLRKWFRGPAVDRATQREALSVKERSDLARLSQSDSPGLYAGIVTPDRTPKAGGSSRTGAHGERRRPPAASTSRRVRRPSKAA
jgi:hypothetical protein